MADEAQAGTRQESTADHIEAAARAADGHDATPIPSGRVPSGLSRGIATSTAAAWRAGAGVRGRGMTLLSIAFACGIAIGWHQGDPVVTPWMIVSGIGLAIASIANLRRASGVSFVCLLAAAAAFGAGWVTLRMEYVAGNDLAALIGDESVLVRLEGTATRSPELRARTSGSMARFDYRPPATYFPMSVDRLLPTYGEPVEVTGAVLVRVDQTLPPFRAGDRVRVTGFLLRPAMPRNPGEFDFRMYAKALGQAGILTVSGRDLVEVTPAEHGWPLMWVYRLRDVMRLRAGAWLLADLPESDRPQRDAVLASLMLGERDAEIDRVYRSFQRVGLAHILAISGFHLAVLAAFVMLVARQIGGARRWHGLIVIAFVLAYLLIVEPRMPVLRAGVMSIAGCLAGVFGRRVRVGGLVALSAAGLLLWRPDQLFSAGFQLTYGVVLALIYLTSPVRERWFGRPNPEAKTSAEMLGEWLKTAVTVAVVAWLAALPIAAYHFGSIALAGIPMSIVAVPLAAVILALGFAKIMLGAILPSVAMIIGIPMTLLTDVLLSLVLVIEPFKWASIDVPHPSTAWSLVFLVWVCWWSLGSRLQRRRTVRLKWATGIILIVWLLAPLLPRVPLIDPRGEPDLLRIDMLAVGDGSCYVLRSGGQTMVFDAGSSTDLSAGERSIVPAMRRLGVRTIDRLCVTHANLDHYSAVIELADAFHVSEAMVSTQFMDAARSDPLSPMAFMLSRLSDRRARVIEIGSGDRWSLGEAHVSCLHPDSSETYERVNDSSVVLRIEVGGRRVLLTGDIQAAGMARLMAPDADLRADVLELPHHGSFHDEAVAFVRSVNPKIVMQSTGWTRWQRDRWGDLLAATDRLITVRDGACTVRIARDGSMQVERFLPPGVSAGGEELE